MRARVGPPGSGRSGQAGRPGRGGVVRFGDMTSSMLYHLPHRVRAVMMGG
jgi:hypothetical protein